MSTSGLYLRPGISAHMTTSGSQFNRAFTVEQGQKLGLTGSVKNDPAYVNLCPLAYEFRHSWM